MTDRKSNKTNTSKQVLGLKDQTRNSSKKTGSCSSVIMQSLTFLLHRNLTFFFLPSKRTRKETVLEQNPLDKWKVV